MIYIEKYADADARQVDVEGEPRRSVALSGFTCC